MASVLQPQSSLVMVPENSPEALTITRPALEPSFTLPSPTRAVITVPILSLTSNVAPVLTITLLEAEISPFDRASVPALITVSPA